MRSSHCWQLPWISCFSVLAHAQYILVDDYAPADFFSMFNFNSAPDKTNGFVQYQTHPDAVKKALVGSIGQGVYLGVDNTTMSPPNGRDSVRIESKITYTHGLFIADIAHMPGGQCGVWPAFWTVGADWPENGEIDIVEQVNLASNNLMTLHTTNGCIMDAGNLSGNDSTNCFYEANNFQGCGLADARPESFGLAFNQAGGGVYAMDWTSDHIAIWFWPRTSIPPNALSDTPDPLQWGKPVADFRGHCDIDSKFREHQIVFDTTFCGDWAGNTWASSPCAASAPTCAQFVGQNPHAFSEAYWQIESLRVFSNETES